MNLISRISVRVYVCMRLDESHFSYICACVCMYEARWISFLCVACRGSTTMISHTCVCVCVCESMYVAPRISILCVVRQKTRYEHPVLLIGKRVVANGVVSTDKMRSSSSLVDVDKKKWWRTPEWANWDFSNIRYSSPRKFLGAHWGTASVYNRNICVIVYICVYIHTHICIAHILNTVCMWTCMYTWIYVNIYIYLHTSLETERERGKCILKNREEERHKLHFRFADFVLRGCIICIYISIYIYIYI